MKPGNSLLLVLATLAATFASTHAGPSAVQPRHKKLLKSKSNDLLQLSTKQNAPQSKELKILESTRGGLIPTPSTNEVKGIAFFFVADIAFRKLFQKLKISFPSQLGGCCILFATLMLVNILTCEHASDAMCAQIAPGAAWLTKWLPVFFVPGLAMLPLAPSIGSAIEVSLFELVDDSFTHETDL